MAKTKTAAGQTAVKKKTGGLGRKKMTLALFR